MKCKEILKSNWRTKIWLGGDQQHLDTRNQNKGIRGKIESFQEHKNNVTNELKQWERRW